MQHPAMSSIRPSNLVQKAVVHCGKVTFVGSVLALDLYTKEEATAVEVASEKS
jgi:hypothetical protein